jgi:signal transduction histidine kinase
MKARMFFRVTLVLVFANVALTLGLLVWSLQALGEIGSPAGAPAGSRPSVANQRLAELYASDAFRYLITSDYAALNAIVRQAAGWPEVVYVSVEDAQGRILAHSDAARIGQTWTPELARSIRSATKGPYEDVVAAMSDPAGDRSKGVIGRVRLGLVTDAPPPAASSAASLPVWAVLAAAIVFALPMAFVVTRLSGGPAAPPVEPTPEAEHARRLAGERQDAVNEAELLRAERTRLRDETARLRRESDGLAESLQLAQEQVDRQATEIATLHAQLEHERTLRAAAAAAPPPSAGGLEDKSRAIREAQYRAVGNIAHVFRHSLTTVLGFARVLLRGLDGGLNERQRADVERIQRAGDELLTFVNTMSELSQADLGALRAQRETVSLATLLAQSAQGCEAGAAVEVMLDPEDAATIAVDSAHVARALRLVLEHAVADARDTTVVATARSHGAEASVELAYRRAPLTDEELDRLFDPFATGPGTSAGVEAARVRLALARALVTANGGRLSVEAGDRSLTFNVTFPHVVGGRPDDARDTVRAQEAAH